MKPFAAVDPPAALAAHAPDVHWTSGEDARCSLWWRRTPPLDGHRVGLIGHYAAVDRETGRAILEHACRELAARNCTLAVGPMDGSTWRSYRLITERGVDPPFFLEPDPPDSWPAHYEDAGFRALARYRSTVTENLDQGDPREGEIAARMASQGVRIRPLDPARIDDELRRIYAVTISSFRRNFLFTPLEEGEFGRMYQALRPFMRSELILLAEREEQTLGFVFGLPDVLQARRGATLDTVVLKTLAVTPGRAWAGLGRLLVSRAHAAARASGFRRVIHALMHDANASIVLSGRTSRPIRRYTLYSREIAP